MAILEEYQGKDIGRKLLLYIENYIRQSGGGLLWFNARTTAVPFYIKSGYEGDGGIFKIPGIGPHILMYKNLKNL
jgi:GNAT superfamily N-acetyltransferase